MTDITSLSRISDQDSIDNIREMTSCFVQNLDPLKVILFGSFADGSYTDESDYDFYIDGTAPKIKLSSADSNIELSNTELLKAKPSDTLRIKCDKIWVGDEKPDHFTKLQLEDMNSNVVKDYLKDQEDNETHEADISLRGLKNGTYRLKTNAVDDVGNKMDDKIYSISVNHKNESIKIQAERSDKVKKSGAKVAVITGIAAVAAAVVIIMRKKAKLG